MNIIVEIKFGSHLYGTNTENSDLDIKGIYLPTSDEILLGNYQKTISKSRPKAEGERNTKDDVDLNYFSLDRFLQLLAEGQTMALDMLFAPESFWTYQNPALIEIFHDIRLHKERLLNKKVNAFVGYAMQQASKYGVKGSRVAAVRDAKGTLAAMLEEELKDPNTLLEDWPSSIQALHELHPEFIMMEDVYDTARKTNMPYLSICGRKFGMNIRVSKVLESVTKLFETYGQRALMAETNQGIDWKALSHAVRVNTEAKELLTTGFITFPRPDRDLLLAIKKGEMQYKDVAEIIETGLAELHEAQKVSTLNDEPDYAWINNFVKETYGWLVYQDMITYFKMDWSMVLK